MVKQILSILLVSINNTSMGSIRALGVALRSPRMSWMMIFGISCGLPYIITKSPLSAWMTTEGVDLKTVGLFSLVGVPYTLKFLWAPVLDRYSTPFLGRRRGWALVFQILIALSILALSFSRPLHDLTWIAFLAFLISFLGASQDVVVDAFRAESWHETELGLANSVHVAGYLMSIRWIGNALALFFADYIGWPNVFRLMAGIQLLGLLPSLFFQELKSSASRPPASLLDAVYLPIKDYFSRRGAVEILLFLVLYKLGENIASVMTVPFFLKIGFEQKTIGIVAKPFGFTGILLGGLIGGVLMTRLEMRRSLWIFGIFQGLATLIFSLLVFTGPNPIILASVITVDNFAIGMGTAAFATFMMNCCNKSFTATQYALLTSLMAVPASFFGATSGYLAESLGWVGFFIFCSLISLPGLLLLFRYPYWKAVSITK
jgi:MFS transporter, PAT family, beta-lactamase induction signal transducer AmpG